jgi:hypothetical protein
MSINSTYPVKHFQAPPHSIFLAQSVVHSCRAAIPGEVDEILCIIIVPLGLSQNIFLLLVLSYFTLMIHFLPYIFDTSLFSNYGIITSMLYHAFLVYDFNITPWYELEIGSRAPLVFNCVVEREKGGRFKYEIS